MPSLEFQYLPLSSERMGSFFTNCQVRSTSTVAVSQALAKLIKQRAYVSPEKNGWISVYLEDTDEQDVKTLCKIAETLSVTLKTDVFAFLVHDSDIANYWLYRGGTLLDEFDSSPDYFKEADKKTHDRVRGKTEVIAPLCIPGTTPAQIDAILHPSDDEGFATFAEDIVREIGKLLGIDEDRISLGFNYFDEDGAEILPDADQFEPIGKGAERKEKSSEEEEDDADESLRALGTPDSFGFAIHMLTQTWSETPTPNKQLEQYATLLGGKTDDLAKQIRTHMDRMARDLLKKSTLPNVPTFEELKAARDQGPEVLARLLATRMPTELTTIGFHTAHTGSEQFMAALLQNGLDPNGTGLGGRTILSAAEQHGKDSAIYKLVKAATEKRG